MDTCLNMIATFLDESGRVTALPAKNKKKLAVIWYLSHKFDVGRNYTEAEINDVIIDWTTFCDPATVRRELFDRRLLNRTKDCKLYWKEKDAPDFEEFFGLLYIAMLLIDNTKKSNRFNSVP